MGLILTNMGVILSYMGVKVQFLPIKNNRPKCHPMMKLNNLMRPAPWGPGRIKLIKIASDIIFPILLHPGKVSIEKMNVSNSEYFFSKIEYYLGIYLLNE